VLKPEHLAHGVSWAVAGSANARLRAHRIVSHTRIDVIRASLSLLGSRHGRSPMPESGIV
jgi:hypothetical protein